MNYQIRESEVSDIEATIDVRGRTRENPVSRERLEEYGITCSSIAESFNSGVCKGFVCMHDSNVVGFCNGDSATGEVLVLAVLPEYERKGIGKRLLSSMVAWLKDKQCPIIWLAADPDPATRAHGFYRSGGWRPTGQLDARGDEILQLHDLD